MSVVDWGRASGFIGQGVGPVGGWESGRVGIWARWGDKQGGSLARWDRVLGGGAVWRVGWRAGAAGGARCCPFLVLLKFQDEKRILTILLPLLHLLSLSDVLSKLAMA